MLHAAGQLVWIFAFETAEARHERESARACSVARGRSSFMTSDGSSTFSSIVRQGSSTGA